MRRCILILAVLATGVLPASASGSTVYFRCDGATVGGNASVEAMENEYALQTGFGACWFHIGHHTYDIGREVALHRVNGSLFSVEIQFSPGIETTSTGFAIVVESSRDGLNWTGMHQATYLLGLTRQSIAFDFDAGGRVARYVRIRQPLSAAQGLSGYIDSSSFQAAVTEVAQPTPGSKPSTLNCADHIMERFWGAHPCWFGGINRYDSPSVFHTYPVGDTVIGALSGSVLIAPWRSDDYTQNGGSRTAVNGLVQTSTDGANWTTLTPFSGTYGAPISFSVSGVTRPAEYVRLVAEYHKGVTAHPALKHVRGFLLDSSITVTPA